MKKIEQILKYDTAGDPISGIKWTRKTTGKIAGELAKANIHVSADTIGRLLKDMNYSLKVNHKEIESTSKKVTKESRNKRNQQFNYIKQMRKNYSKQGNVIISTDAKKREQIGNFRNAGAIWCNTPKKVNVYDFKSLSVGVFIPYGIYNMKRNTGFIVGGISYNTAEFAISAIEKWWLKEGNDMYSKQKKLLILADGGGSNGSNNKLWKLCIQQKLCDKYGISVSVCHYPPGTSKYNPIEHRLFSEISKNWAGEPLKDYETTLNYINTTKTLTGLKVKGILDKKIYEKGIKISDKEMKKINIKYHNILPEWNYSIYPTKSDLILR